tara:strand:- start:1 stop:534 length:534 start_codon:yes stop_codon:yes gene_type:complete
MTVAEMEEALKKATHAGHAIASSSSSTSKSAGKSGKAKAPPKPRKKKCPFPEEGKWRGLYQMTSKASTGKAVCKACNEVIKKGTGLKQVQMSDNSLFKMMVLPGDVHEGVSRGYVECTYKEFPTVSRKTFWVHPECADAAAALCEELFREEWKRLRKCLKNDPFCEEYFDEEVYTNT